MKTLSTIRIILLVFLLTLVGCQPATSTASIPTNTSVPVTLAILSATITPTYTPEPESILILTNTRQSDGMKIVSIPAGKFTMGSDEGAADEAPVHEVYLDTYWMDATEITNGMYAKCVDARVCLQPLQLDSYTRSSYFGERRYENYPVIYVDWNMANTYCEWAGARLPTEAEWEKAARSEDGRIFPWGNNWDVGKLRRLNFADKNTPETTSDITLDDGYRDTAPTGNYPSGRSPYEIYDMAGNVWEWVADWYDPLYYDNSPMDNPQGPTQELLMRVLRGGSWVAANENVFHASNRNGLEPSKFSESIGFRCAS